MKRSLVPALASLLLTVDVRAAEPRWTVEFKEGAYTFLTATGLEVGQKTGSGAIAGYLVVKLPADVDPATTNRGVFLGRVRVPERRVTWLKGDEFAAGDLLPAHHLIAITPNAGFEPGLWAVKVRDTVKDRSGRPINPTNATWTVEIGEPRARPDDPGPARNTLKLKFTTEVDPATYADGIVLEKQVAGGWEEEPRGSATIAPSAHGGSVNEIGLRPLGGWERGATYRVRVTDAIRDVRGLPLTNAEDFSFTVPKSGPFETRHEPRRPVAQASAQAAAAGPAFPGGQALGWHGHWTDPVTGLIYMRNRWYDPRTGTFLSPDPLEDIDSPNQYLFGVGRPHEVVDPLGLAVKLPPGTYDAKRRGQAAADSWRYLSWLAGAPSSLITDNAYRREFLETAADLVRNVEGWVFDRPEWDLIGLASAPRLPARSGLPFVLRRSERVTEGGEKVIELGEGLATYRVDPLGRTVEVEAKAAGRVAGRGKGYRPEPPGGRSTGEHRGHLAPEGTAPDPRAVNVQENIISEAAASNLGPKKSFDNLLAKLVSENPNANVASKHRNLYSGNSMRPYAVEHSIVIDGQTVYAVVIENK